MRFLLLLLLVAGCRQTLGSVVDTSRRTLLGTEAVAEGYVHGISVWDRAQKSAIVAEAKKRQDRAWGLKALDAHISLRGKLNIAAIAVKVLIASGAAIIDAAEISGQLDVAAFEAWRKAVAVALGELLKLLRDVGVPGLAPLPSGLIAGEGISPRGAPEVFALKYAGREVLRVDKMRNKITLVDKASNVWVPATELDLRAWGRPTKSESERLCQTRPEVERSSCLECLVGGRMWRFGTETSVGKCFIEFGESVEGR